MKKTSLLLTMLMLMCFGMAKAETVHIGDGGTTAGSGLPSAVNWNYCLSEQIYTVAEVGKTGTITSVAFKPVSGQPQTRTFDIYMTMTEKASFLTTSDWIPFSQSDLVFSGNVEFVMGEWATVTLDESFVFDGTGNLCLCVIDKTGTYIQSKSINWLVYGATKQSLLIYKDSTPAYDPAQFLFTEEGKYKDYKDQIQLTFEEGGGEELGENVVEIGTEPVTDVYLPTYTYYNYSLTQQFYDWYETEFITDINSISFYSVDETMTRTIDLYLKSTVWGEFTQTNGWVPFAEEDKVFSGSVTFKANEWTTITLDRTFHHDGARLCVIVDDNTGSYMSSPRPFLAGASNYNRSRYAYSDGTNFTSGNIGENSGNISNKRSLIRLNRGNVIGSSNYKLPVTIYDSYSVSQQIYTPDEIGRGGTISSIGFYDVTGSATRNIDIYMTHTSQSEYALNGQGEQSNQWVAAPARDKVFSGNVTFRKGEWTMIELDTPFAYNGSDNLVITVDDNTGDDPGMICFATFGANARQSLCKSSDDDYNYRMDNLSTYYGWAQSIKNQLRLDFGAGGSGTDPQPGVVEIGDGGTALNNYLPTYTFYNYSLTQQIYTKEEMGSAQPLQSIAFFNNGQERERNMDIYLVHTSKTAFSGSTDWIPFTEADKVFSGAVNFESGDWTVIPFSEPFSYNGKDNLAVIVDDNSGTYSSGMSCLVFNATGQALRIYSDQVNYDASALNDYNGATLDVKNQIKFNYAPLPKPESVEVSNVTYESAYITWESEGSTWNLQYKAEDESEWTSVSGLTSRSYELTGLAVFTTYSVRVQIVFSDGTSGGWKVAQFTTLEQYPRPTNLAVSDVTPNSATLSWKENAGGTGWRIYITDNDGQEDYIETSTNPFTLTNLRPSTQYNVNVLTLIGGTESLWSNRFDFTTLESNPVPFDVAVSPAPTAATISWTGFGDSYEVRYKKATGDIFYEDFEEGVGERGWGVYTESYAPNGNGWYIEELGSSAVSGKRVACSSSYYNTSEPADNWLVSPELELRGILKFWTKSYNSMNLDSYEVWLSTTGNTIEDFKSGTMLQSLQDAPNEWTEVTFDLSAYAGQKGYIAIRHYCTDKYYLYIDDFGLYSTDESWRTVNTTETEATITGLQTSTAYYYQVTSLKAGEESATTDFAAFTTLEKHPAPFDIAVSTTSTTATISWTGFSDRYEVKYRKIGSYVFFEGFEGGALPEGWTTVDADGDAWNWYTPTDALAKELDMSGFEKHSGTGLIASASYVNNVGVLTPDNWLITPQLDLQGAVTAWLRGQDPDYPAEHFAFYVSTTGTDLGDFTQISEEFVATGEYQEYRADLSAYAGQKGYIAIRHFNVSDQYWLNLDDFGILSDGSNTAGKWNTVKTTGTEVTLTDLEEGTMYDYQITGKMSGEPDAVTDMGSFCTSAPYSLVLDSKGDNYRLILENEGMTHTVLIKGRTFRKDGRWEGLCLPFDLALEGSILEGADVRAAESVSQEGNFLIVDCLTPVTKILASTPYIIRWDGGDDIVNPIFEDVVIAHPGESPMTGFALDDKVAFIGAYDVLHTRADATYVVNGGLSLGLLSLQAEPLLFPFDAYFQLHPDFIGTIEGIGLNVGDRDETIVGLKSLNEQKDSDEAIYNLAGQRMSKKQKGINITTGRKMLVN